MVARSPAPSPVGTPKALSGETWMNTPVCCVPPSPNDRPRRPMRNVTIPPGSAKVH
jgi:hypothetical protein